MAVKLMIFIDGSWLYRNWVEMKEQVDPSLTIDYRQLPKVIRDVVSQHVDTEVDIVRTHFFGSKPINKPDFDPSAQLNFYKMLERDCHYTNEIYDIDYRNREDYDPREKCVDVALATSMLFYAAISGAYDVAALVTGDKDYMPLLRRVKQLGKRTMLVGIKAVGDHHRPTNSVYFDDHSLLDFPIMFLDEYLDELRLVRKERLRQCRSCQQELMTGWEGPVFYCDSCREEFERLKTEGSLRPCRTCGASVETTWQGEVFYCDDCRRKHRQGR